MEDNTVSTKSRQIRYESEDGPADVLAQCAIFAGCLIWTKVKGLFIGVQDPLT